MRWRSSVWLPDETVASSALDNLQLPDAWYQDSQGLFYWLVWLKLPNIFYFNALFPFVNVFNFMVIAGAINGRISLDLIDLLRDQCIHHYSSVFELDVCGSPSELVFVYLSLLKLLMTL